MILRQYLSEQVQPGRFEHCERTASYAAGLAGRYGLNPDICFRAALMHDLARDFDDQRLIRCALDGGKELSELEIERPVLLHGWCGARILSQKFRCISDEELEAVRCHTSGAPGMGRIAKIVFCADYLEPGRGHIDQGFRESLISLSLDQVCIRVLDHQFDHLRRTGRRIVNDSLLLYDELKRGERETGK